MPAPLLKRMLRLTGWHKDGSSTSQKTTVVATDEALNGAIFDVLVSSLPFVQSRHDVLSVMRTCRALYSAGIPTLLSFEIRLSFCHDLISFCDFIFVDLPHRAHPIKHLSLLTRACKEHKPSITSTSSPNRTHSPGSRSISLKHTLGGSATSEAGSQLPSSSEPQNHSYLARHLFKILQHAKTLRTLRVLSLEEWLQAEPQLITAIAHHTQLRTLSLVVWTGGSTGRLLNDIQAPLTTLNLTFATEHDDPNLCLAALPDSLEELYLCNGEPSTTIGKQYPNVHTLSMSLWRPLDAEALVHTFPNVKQLTCRRPGDSSLARNTNAMDEHRRTNKQRHARNGTWKNLEVLRGDPASLYVLGIHCHVSTLCVDWKYTGSRPGQFLQVLEDAQPVHLLFRISPESLLLVTQHGPLPEAAKARLTTLAIRLEGGTIGLVPNADRLAGLSDLLASLTNLTHVSIDAAFTPYINDGIHTQIAVSWAESHARYMASKCPPSVRHLTLHYPDLQWSDWEILTREETDVGAAGPAEREMPRVRLLSEEEAKRSWPQRSSELATYTDHSLNWFH